MCNFLLIKIYKSINLRILTDKISDNTHQLNILCKYKD